MTVFTRQLETAKRLIAKNGAAMTYVASDGEGGGTPYDVKIVLLPNKRVNAEFIRLLTGMDVQAGDQVGLMGSVPFEPNTADTITLTLTGRPYRVLNAKALQPDGTPLIWTMELAG